MVKMIEPTCHNCKTYGTPKCPDCSGYKHDYDTLCLEHPRIREHLMKDVIEELERLKEKHRVDCFDYGMSKEQHEDHGQYLAYNYAISLIKNRVEK